MSSRPEVLLVTSEPATQNAVCAALESDGRPAPQGICQDLRDLQTRLDSTAGGVPAVLVDIDPQPTRMLSDLEPIIARHTDTRFVVLSSAMRSELMLEAMQVGSRHFLVKQSIAAELPGVLARLIPNGATKTESRGALVTVLSASGGSGATTLAVNLANELHLATSETTLLIDLDWCYGAVASYLGLEGQYGLSDVLAYVGPIDAQLISSTALSCSGMEVLISPASTNLAAPATLDHRRLVQALEACKHAYAFSVIDAPRVPTELAADLARASVMVLLVLQLTVKDIRVARGMVAALAERGVPPERVLLLANRYHKRSPMVTFDEARKALGAAATGGGSKPILQALSNDFAAAVRAINFGQPLSAAAPRSALRKDFQKLTGRIVAAHAARSVKASRGS